MRKDGEMGALISGDFPLLLPLNTPPPQDKMVGNVALGGGGNAAGWGKLIPSSCAWQEQEEANQRST